MELPSEEVYAEIFRRAAVDRGIAVGQDSLDYVLRKYSTEGRQRRSCEPRDLLNRVTDICVFQGSQPMLTPELLDQAWGNYFGIAHGSGKSMAQTAG